MKTNKSSRKRRKRTAVDINRGEARRKAELSDEIRVVHSDEPNPHDG